MKSHPTPSPRVCPHCGAAIPANAPAQLCSRCLLNSAATDTDADLPQPKQSPPSIEEVSKAFPDLQILSLVGIGGMGFVYRVQARSDGRESALKLLPAALAADPAFVERFEREARTLARLHHPNIVAVHGFGRTTHFCYLLMEFVDGANLRQAMRTARFSPSETLALVPQLCDALQYAHAQGVLHRDIKPENILLDHQGIPKIADFGIAKLLGDANSPDQFTLTQTGQRVGTPHYMAPEQIESPNSVDHRADIYSLGVVLYELLTGELPLGRFPAPSVKAALDARIDEIVFRALSKERELRQQSANQVRHEVESLESTPATPPPATPARSTDCYLSSAAHLQSLSGYINIYSDRGVLRLEPGRLVFVSARQTTIIPFSQISGLSIGEYPKFMKPTGLEYIAVRFTSENQEQTLFFTPHQSRWAPTWDTNIVVRDWDQILREAITKSGLPPVPAIPATARAVRAGRSPGVWAMMLLPPVIAVTIYALCLRHVTQGLVGGSVGSLLLFIVGSLVAGATVVSIPSLIAKNQKRFPRIGNVGWIFLVILFITILPLALSVGLLYAPWRLPGIRMPDSPSPVIDVPRPVFVATVQRLHDLFSLIDAASNRVGCLPPTLRTFGLTATDPNSHQPFIYLGGNPNRQSPLLAFTPFTPDSNQHAVLLTDGSGQILKPEELGAFLVAETRESQKQIRDLEASGRVSPGLNVALHNWATEGVLLPAGMSLSRAEASAVQAWGTTVIIDFPSSQQFRVANGSLPDAFWTAADEISRNGKPSLALEALTPFLDFMAQVPGPIRFEFQLAGHQYQVSDQGLAAIVIVLAAHAGDTTRLELGQRLLTRFVGTQADSDLKVTLFNRFKPGEEKQLTEVVQLDLGSLRRALPTHFLFPKLVHRTPDHPEGSAPLTVPVPWLPHR